MFVASAIDVVNVDDVFCCWCDGVDGDIDAAAVDEYVEAPIDGDRVEFRSVDDPMADRRCEKSKRSLSKNGRFATADEPYNKSTKFKLCSVDESVDSSASFVGSVVNFNGVLDRLLNSILLHAFVSSGIAIDGDDLFVSSLSFIPLGDAVSKRSLASSLFDDDGMTTAIGFFFIDKFNGSLYSIVCWNFLIHFS